MSQEAIEELSRLPSLAGRWVAIAPQGDRDDRITPLNLALRSGAVVVDADLDLDVLCARLNATRQTSLTILFAGTRSH